MVRSVRHKALQRLYERGERKGLPGGQAAKLERILARLDVVTGPKGMDLPGWRLHRLKGDRAGFWAVWVTGNWRVVFRFDGRDVYEVDYLDYH